VPAIFFFFYVDKSNAFYVEKVKTEPEEVEDKEFKEEKKALVPSRLRLDHSMHNALLSSLNSSSSKVRF
jgi:hypothetical protein